MLRSLTNRLSPLSRALVAPLATQLRPALGAMAPRLGDGLRHFSVESSRDEGDNIPVEKKRSTPPVEKQKRPMTMSPWEQFFRSSGFDDDIFFRDPFFSRDPFFQSFFNSELDPFERIRREMMPVLRSRPSLMNRGSSKLVKASPGYEIKEDDGAYEIALDIPSGLETKDLQVELEGDGSIVHVSGERSVSEEGVESVTRFSKRFSIGDGVDTENIQANFADGCLVIRAPKLAEAGKRKIEITSRPHKELTDEEIRQKNYSDAFDESDWAETGKKAAA